MLLQVLDHHWREHLVMLEHLRSVIGLRGYAQRDPLNEYKSEAFALFERLLSQLRIDVTRQIGALRPMTPEEQAERQRMVDEMRARIQAQMEAQLQARAEAAAAAEQAQRDALPAGAMAFSLGVNGAATEDAADPNDPSTWSKTGRNSPCPCGSGKKYKHCHGRLA